MEGYIHVATNLTQLQSEDKIDSSPIKLPFLTGNLKFIWSVNILLNMNFNTLIKLARSIRIMETWESHDI